MYLILNLQSLPVLENAVEAGACMLSFFFGKTPCEAGFGSYQSSFNDLFISVLNFTILPTYATNFVLIGVQLVLDETFSPDQIACYIFVGLYDMSFGNMANNIRSLCYLIGCLVGAISNPLGSTLYELGQITWMLFGWQGGDGNFRDQICSVIDAITEVIVFLAEFFQNPAYAVYDLILPLLNQIIGFINTLLCKIEEPLYAASSGLQGVWTCVLGMFDIYIPLILDCIALNKDGACGKLGGLPCAPPQFTGGCYEQLSPLQPATRSKQIKKDENEIPSDPITLIEMFEYPVNEEGHPCYKQYSLLNETKDNVTFFLMQKDLANCIFSASVARLFDIILTDNVTLTSPIVDPMFLYDTITFVNVTLTVGSGVRAAIYFQTLKNSTLNWEEFANISGINQNGLKYAVGSWISGIIDRITSYGNSTSFSNAFSFFKNLFTNLGAVANAYLNVSNNISKRDPHTNTERITLKSVFIDQSILNTTAIGIAIVHPLNVSSTWITNQFNTFKNFLSRKYNSGKNVRSTRVSRNRNAILRILNVVQSKVKHGYLGRRSSDCPLNGYGKRSCGPVDLCIDGACLQCAVVEQLVDVFVEGICNCINRSANGIPTSAQLTGNTTIIQQENKRNQYYWGMEEGERKREEGEEEEYHEFRTRVLVNTSSDSNQKIGNEVNDFILSIFDHIISFLFPSYSGTESYTHSIGNFFTNTNSSDTDSIFFWLLFFSPAGCDIDTMVTGDRGYGIQKGLVITVLFYVIGLIVGTILFGPIQSLMLILLPFAISVLMATSYLMAPGCLFPTPLPLLPYPFADDLYRLYASWNADCINWDSFLPGITSPICPNATDDYTRSFVDCSSPPYSFVDGFRNVFFYIQWKAPGFANFLQVTEVPFVSWIRQVDFLEKRLEFDFGPTGMPNDTWISCNYETIGPNIYTIAIAMLAPVILIFFFLPAVVQLIQISVTILYIIILAFVEVIVTMTGAVHDRKKYFRDEKELPNPPHTSKKSKVESSTKFGSFNKKPISNDIKKNQ